MLSHLFASSAISTSLVFGFHLGNFFLLSFKIKMLLLYSYSAIIRYTVNNFLWQGNFYGLETSQGEKMERNLLLSRWWGSPALQLELSSELTLSLLQSCTVRHKVLILTRSIFGWIQIIAAEGEKMREAMVMPGKAKERREPAPSLAPSRNQEPRG